MPPGRLYRLLLSPDGDGGGGGDPPPAKPAEGDATLKQIEALVTKHGADGALRYLLNERDAKADEAKSLRGKVPPEGAVVLAGDDAKRYAAYVALGDPEALRTALEDRDRFKGQVDGHEREKVHRKVAGLLGYTGPGAEAFVEQAGLRGLEFEFAEEKDKAGKPAEVPYLKAAGEGQARVKAEDFVATKLAHYLPAFRPEAQKTVGGTPARPARAPVPAPGASGEPPRKPALRF